MAELAALAAAYPVAASVAGGVAGSVIGKMISPDAQTTSAPAAPTVTPAPTMPTPGDANTDAAKRKSLAEQLARPQVKPLPSQIPPTIFFVRDSTKK